MTTFVQSTMREPSFLRRTLQLDGSICVVSGLAMAAAASQAAMLTGIQSPGAIAALGLTLVAYGAVLLVVSRGQRLDRRMVIASMAADLLWVAGSAVLLTGRLPLTTVGWWSILVVALGVVAFAEAKFWGLWRTR